MKRALILLLAIISLASASCKKKSTDKTKTYFCIKNDSVYSNIPALLNPHFKVTSGYYSHYSDWQIKLLIKETAADIDTIFFRHDTVQVRYPSMTCEVYE